MVEQRTESWRSHDLVCVVHSAVRGRSSVGCDRIDVRRATCDPNHDIAPEHLGSGLLSATRLGGEVALLLAIGAAACGTRSSAYDKLCKLYEQYPPLDQDNGGDMQAANIYERVQRELPEIMPVYEVLIMNDVDVRYQRFVEQARRDTKKPDWQCEAMRNHWSASTHSR